MINIESLKGRVKRFQELIKQKNLDVNVHPLIMQLRMVKEDNEIKATQKASRIVEVGMRKAVDEVDAGKTELEVAAEAIADMMKKGSENPHIYITSGPKPRIHAEPRSNHKIQPNDTVEIVVSADYEGYYSNLTRTVF